MGRNTEELPIIIAQSGPLNGHRWVIKNKLIIGRDQICDIVIPERQVSRQHARFTRDTTGVTLEDLGSKNGTHHNGALVTTPVSLNDGDIIQISLIQSFLFTSSDATLPLNGEILLQSSISPYLLKIEKNSRRVWVGDIEVDPPLSVAQYRLLEILYDKQNQVISRSDIIEYVWGKKQAILISEQALDALIRRLRDRFASIDPTHEFLITIRGHGLRLDNPIS